MLLCAVYMIITLPPTLTYTVCAGHKKHLNMFDQANTNHWALFLTKYPNVVIVMLHVRLHNISLTIAHKKDLWFKTRQLLISSRDVPLRTFKKTRLFCSSSLYSGSSKAVLADPWSAVDFITHSNAHWGQQLCKGGWRSIKKWVTSYQHSISWSFFFVIFCIFHTVIMSDVKVKHGHGPKLVM